MTISSGIQNLSQNTYRQANYALSGQAQAVAKTQQSDFETQTTAAKTTAAASADSQSQHFPELFSRSGQALTPLAVQLKAIHVSELPEERYQEFMQAQKQLIEANQQYLEHQYSSRNKPQPENLPQTQPYATIKVGGKVVAAMKRTGAPDEFRSNLHRGGSAQVIKITPEERSTAVRAAKRMGLNVCGVDMLRSNHGPVIMEVNSSPGLEGIENATGKNIAGMIIDFIEGNFKAGATKTKGKG